MKRFKRILWILMAVVLFAVAAGGCPPAAAPPEPEAPAPVEVVIGLSAPLSGPAAEYGQDVLNGVDMAVNDINEAGGITIDGQNYVFRVIYLDDAADPTMAVTNARRLRDVNNAIAIFNPVYSCIAPMLVFNQEEGNEFLVMAYTSIGGEYLVDPPNELVVWLPPAFNVYAEAFAANAIERGWTNGAMVVTTGAYGDIWRGTFKAIFEAKGGVIVADQPAPYYGATDFSTQITAALAANPDFLLIGGPSGPTALVVEQARELGFTGGFALIDQAKMDYVAMLLEGGYELLGDAVGVSPTYSVTNPGMQSFYQRYEELYVATGKALLNTWEAAINYTATHALIRAMEIAGSVTDARAIRAALPQVFPLSADEFPTEVIGMTDLGRLYMMATTMALEDGDYGTLYLHLWWPTTEEEFTAAKEQLFLGPDDVAVWSKWP